MSTSAPGGLEEYTLKTIALFVCDPELWVWHEYTFERYKEIQGILDFCLRAVQGVPGCEWMTEPLLEIQKRVRDKQQIDFFLRGAWLWQ